MPDCVLCGDCDLNAHQQPDSLLQLLEGYAADREKLRAGTADLKSKIAGLLRQGDSLSIKVKVLDRAAKMSSVTGRKHRMWHRNERKVTGIDV